MLYGKLIVGSVFVMLLFDFPLGVISVVISFLVFATMRTLFVALYQSKLSPISSFIVSLVPIVAIVVILFTVIRYDIDDVDAFISLLFSLLTVPAVIISLLLAKILVDLLRKLALLTFQAASDPTTPPFAYAAALLNVLIIGVRLAFSVT
jgi:hypothetical protein